MKSLAPYIHSVVNIELFLSSFLLFHFYNHLQVLSPLITLFTLVSFITRPPQVPPVQSILHTFTRSIFLKCHFHPLTQKTFQYFSSHAGIKSKHLSWRLGSFAFTLRYISTLFHSHPMWEFCPPASFYSCPSSFLVWSCPFLPEFYPSSFYIFLKHCTEGL